MPQAISISINDGATTPVAHVFAPAKVQDTTAVFRNSSSSVLATREELTVRLREGRGVVPPKVSIKLLLPVEGTVDGQVVAAREYLGSIDFVISPKGTKEERKKYRTLLANTLLNAEIAKVIDDVESMF